MTHQKRFTVWCEFCSKGIIGPFFYESKQGEADRYRAMLNEFLFTKIEEEDISNIQFQQIGPTCHRAEDILTVLRPVFEYRIISHRTFVVWPPLSCDLTPLDYYLWGAVTDKCYADKPETINALKGNIREAIGEMQLHTIYNVLKNWTDRIDYYFPLLTERVVLSNKKRNLRKYSVAFF